MPESSADRAFRLRQIGAFLAVYLIWGSTYLAIRFAIETLPGFLMAGTRFLVAGALLYGFARLRGAPRPSALHWRTAAVIGALLLLGGNGAVVWAEQRIPSGLAALLVGTEPLWVAVFLAFLGERPTLRTGAALGVGFLGAAVLAAPAEIVGGQDVHLVSALVTVFACVSWAAGSLYARRAPMPQHAAMASGSQMLAGGLFLALLGFAVGEHHQLDFAAVEPRSVLALAYLTVFGSIIAFSAYSFLIRTTDATLVATYAYVNPVVAVLLGWLFADEPLGPKTLLSAALIIGSVVVISSERRPPRRRAPADDAPPAVATGDETPPVVVREGLERCA